MHSWSAPEVPRLPGRGAAVHVHDTATGSVREVGPRVPGETAARIYVCGITPYDATHLGHAATYIAFDLLLRAWRDAGHDVAYVQNVTDVDDPLLERAAQTGEDWTTLAERETELFREDMHALSVLPPSHYVGAVEAIPLVLDLVDELRGRGAVYDVDGDLYFSVSSDEAFGSVSGLTRDQMVLLFAERGGDPDRAGKKDPLDCLLWQRQRRGEPGWDAPFGTGRPGWHVECTAIALHHLGPSFDVQGGGSDLVFPHHEMCAAAGHVGSGVRPFAQAYVHSGMVGLGGDKMSKSRGNLVFVSRLRQQGVDPAAIRLALLSHHYRSDWGWSHEDLQRALTRLSSWRDAVHSDSVAPAGPLLAAVRERLADDLDAPGAIAAVDAWAAAARGQGHRDVVHTAAPGAGELVAQTVDALLGVKL